MDTLSSRLRLDSFDAAAHCMNTILKRLKEPSTWKGLISLAAIAGWQLNVAQEEQIVAAALSLVALIEILRVGK